MLITVDGLPCSGKTSLASELSRTGWKALPEVATLAGQLGLPIGSDGNLSTDIFILCEETRREERARTLRDQGERVILESSNLANLAYAQVRGRGTRSQSSNIYSDYYRLVSKHNLRPVPDLYVILRISPMESILRQREDPSRPFRTLDKSFLGRIERSLDEVHERFDLDVPRLRLTGEDSSAKNRERIEQFLVSSSDP